MLGSIPHQKFCFYHLPTRGRVGVNDVGWNLYGRSLTKGEDLEKNTKNEHWV